MDNNEYPRKRADALAAGATHYFTGKPCKRGHLSPRHAKFGDCLECKKLALREWRAINPAKSYELTKAWRAANPAANREMRRQEYHRDPLKALARLRKRQAAKLQRTPPWADLRAIAQFYVDCPPGLTVDHVIPLRGRLVCGLHTIKNLQYLSLEANLKKSNKFDPDTYIHEL